MAGGTKIKWRRRSREQWREVLARFAASGLGVERFCAREGISKSSFRRWRAVLADGRPAAAPDTPPLEVAGFVDAGVLGLGRTGRFEIRLELGDGVVLHLVRG